MNDIEITKRCAEAMGLTVWPEKHSDGLFVDGRGPVLQGTFSTLWNPLTNDAQAMALVKKFVLHIEWLATKDWSVDFGSRAQIQFVACNSDLNRAICECVAKMQKSQA